MNAVELAFQGAQSIFTAGGWHRDHAASGVRWRWFVKGTSWELVAYEDGRWFVEDAQGAMFDGVRTVGYFEGTSSDLRSAKIMAIRTYRWARRRPR